MEVTLVSTNRRVHKELERDFHWYDHIEKKMLHFRGGRMEFFYDSKKKRSIPRIVDSKEWVIENSYPDILQWIKQNQLEFGFEIVNAVPERYINLNIEASMWDDMSRSLYINKIRFDYDERQMRSELKETRGGNKWQNSESKLQIRQLH